MTLVIPGALATLTTPQIPGTLEVDISRVDPSVISLLFSHTYPMTLLSRLSGRLLSRSTKILQLPAALGISLLPTVLGIPVAPAPAVALAMPALPATL